MAKRKTSTPQTYEQIRDLIDSRIKNGVYTGNLNLSKYPFPLPERLRKIDGDLQLNRYAHPLPGNLAEITGHVHLSKYEWPLPSGTYAHPLPKGLKEISVHSWDLQSYPFPLPDSITRIRGDLDLSKYKFALPKNLKTVVGDVVLVDYLNVEVYSHPLPPDLKYITGSLRLSDNFYDDDYKKYAYSLPERLTAVGSIPDTYGYMGRLPDSLTHVGHVLNLSHYRYPAPKGLKDIGSKLILDGYNFDLPSNLTKLPDVEHLNDYGRPLPENLVSIGGIDLSGYPFPLPPKIKKTGSLQLSDYDFELPRNLKKIEGDLLGLSRYKHDLPDELEEITGKLDLTSDGSERYDRPLPSSLRSVGSLSLDGKYKFLLPESLKEITNRLSIRADYKFPMPHGMKKTRVINVDKGYKFADSLPAVGINDHYQIKTPDSVSFRSWFARSKVVDEKGDPKVVFHGTNLGGFVAFDPAKKDAHHPGYYFADTLDNAKTYIERPKKKILDPTPKLGAQPLSDKIHGAYRVFLSIQNPAVVECEGRYWDDIVHSDYPGLRKTYEIATEAKRRGHDGVIFHNVIDSGGKSEGRVLGAVYVAFDPTQIKSALINTGAYSKTDPDIRKNPRRTSRRPVRRTSRGRKTSRGSKTSRH